MSIRTITIPFPVLVTDVAGNTSPCTANIYVEEGTALPDGWNGYDVGTVTLGNEYDYEPCSGGGEFHIVGSGMNALGSVTDDVAFAATSLCGNGSITAKIENVDPNGYGGLMIRESAAAGAKQAAVFSNQTSILRHEVRYTTNGAKQVNSFFKPSPFWLKLERQGDWIFTYYSTTGGSFQYVHGVFVPMQNCVEIGLASFTNFPFAQTETVFSNVVISGGNAGFSNNGDSPNEALAPLASSLSKSVVWPNPTANEFTLQLDSPAEADQVMGLYNAFGQRVATRRIAAGEQELHWNVEDIPAGAYWLRTEGAKQIHKIIISR